MDKIIHATAAESSMPKAMNGRLLTSIAAATVGKEIRKTLSPNENSNRCWRLI